MKIFFKQFLILYFTLIISSILILFFEPIFSNTNITYSLGFMSINFSKKIPKIWNIIKLTYLIICPISFFIILNSFTSFLKVTLLTINFKHEKKVFNNNPYNEPLLTLGTNSNNTNVSIPLKGLYQNVLVTGSIGSGKTSSLLYPITSNLLNLSFSEKYKSAFLILDVKGNYHRFVKDCCKQNYHLGDLFIISLDGNITYNPIDKPNLKPHILANRLKNILLLFNPEQSESFWLDKAEQVLTEAIKLCRLYNGNYVTFIELHKIIMSKSYYDEKVSILQDLFYNNKLSEAQMSDFATCISFFSEEFFSLDERTLSILRSEISRITNIFVSDNDVSRIFCPSKNQISFPGFEYILKNHKIVVLDMNISEYSNLSKIIAAYLKIDFQSEILIQLSKSSEIYPSCFICDEYHEYVTKNDSSFFAQSREAKCINIVATQSYSSILSSIGNPTDTKVLIQNLVNKFWFRTDDSFTIEEILKQTGKEEKEIKSKTISENARQTNYNFLLNSFFSKDSNISESINTSYQKDFIFDSNFFSRDLETFSCLAFISTGTHILPIEKIWLKPYFS